jgi:hypothetical protein
MGATDLLLWALEDNFDAQRTYKAVGFEPTGEREFLPAVGRVERRLRLVLDRLPDSEPSSCRLGADCDSTKLSEGPGFQLQEVHRLRDAAHIVDVV